MEPKQKLVKASVKAGISIFLLLILKTLLHQFGFMQNFMMYIDLGISILIAILLINFNKEVKSPLSNLLPHFPEAIIIVTQIVVLIVIITLYKPLTVIISRYIMDFRWLIQLLFAILIFIPIFKVAKLIYENLDRLTDLITGKVTDQSKSVKKD